MSAGYAARLKDYPNKGVCGLPERFESPRCLKLKTRRLADMIRAAKHVVVITGAGISTAAGIPDFRGPRGIWTLEQEDKKQASNKKRKREPVSVDFARAKPTYTHMAITKLVSKNLVKFCITQNVDGLHQRSGLSRDKMAALHGCAFTEKCENESCQAEHFRDFDVGGLSFQRTGRTCSLCRGALRDTLLDWEDALPEKDYDRATSECEDSDLVICLGTSLRIEPVGSLPTKAQQYVIVNLQVTPKDEDAALIIRGRVDDVMQGVMEELGYSDVEDTPPIDRLWTPT